MKNFTNNSSFIKITAAIISFFIAANSFGQAPTINLTTQIGTSSAPVAPTTIEWYTDSLLTIPVTNLTAAPVGLYYAVYNYGTCKSKPTQLRFITNNCPDITVNLFNYIDSTKKPVGSVVNFHTGTPATLANKIANAQALIASANDTAYYYSYFDATSNCFSTTAKIVVKKTDCSVFNPDVNVTNVGVPVSGNMATNDVLSANTTFGTPALQPGSPAGATISITMNANGTYSFTSNKAGVYNYLVPVCTAPTVVPNCPLELLTITVLDPTVLTNTPVANTDLATTSQNTPVTLNTLSNDKGGNNGVGLKPSSVTITAQPKNGTVTVNPVTGNTTYTPNTGFSGIDTLTYSVCDSTNPTAICQTALQIITIKPTSSTNNFVTAADDYNAVNKGVTATGNIIGNDANSNSHKLSTTPQTTAIAGVGTLTLGSDGVYSFVPNPNFTGPVDFPYTVCDSTTSPIVCAQATLHILVSYTATLNIQLESFKVESNVCTAILNWSVSSIKNIQQFEIERAQKGNVFEKIGTVEINAQSPNAFIYNDEVPASGEWHYRIKSVEINGINSYSQTESIKSQCDKTSVQLIPNPVESNSNIIVNTPFIGSESNIKVYDMTGRLVLSNAVKNDQNTNTIPLNADVLAIGIYTLKVEVGTELFVIKLVKK